MLVFKCYINLVETKKLSSRLRCFRLIHDSNMLSIKAWNDIPIKIREKRTVIVKSTDKLSEKAFYEQWKLMYAPSEN